MTQKQIAKASDRLASLYQHRELLINGIDIMRIVDEIVELELLLESEMRGLGKALRASN